MDGFQHKALTAVRIIVFGLLVLLSQSFSGFGQTIKTWLPTSGGSWTNAANWSGGTLPVSGDDVVINSNQSAPITAIPTISLNNLTVSGTCSFEGPPSSSSLTIQGKFTLSPGFSLSLNNKITLLFGAVSKAFIAGLLTTSNDIICNSDMSIGSEGIINGTGRFTLNAGATLRIGSVNGIMLGNVAVGNIQTTGARTYNAGANYVYNGVAAQNMGDGFPAALSTSGSLTIDNPVSVTIPPAARTISGNLVLLRGVFITTNGGPRLTLGANPYSVTTMVKRSGGSLSGFIQGNNWYEIEYSGTSKTTGDEWSGVGMRNLRVSLNATDTLYLNTNKAIQNYLYLNSGLLHTQSFTLTHLDQTEGSIFGAGPGSYIIGRFRRLIAPGIGDYTFPVGGSSFSPVKISFSQSDGGSVVVRSANGDHPGINSSSLNTLRTVNRYWYTVADSGLLNYSCALTLNWALSDQDVYFNRVSAVAAVFNRSASSWTYPSLNAAVTGNTSLQVVGIASLQDFQVGQLCKYTSITSQPVGGSVCENSGSLTLSVTAGGDEPFTYQWQKDGANLINAYASSYSTSQAGTYRVIVTGQCGTILSDTARVVPKLITTIVAQPASAVICTGNTVELSVSATGENVTYQWNKDGLPISGAISAKYVAAAAGNYSVGVAGACGTVTSGTAVVSFYKPTTILTQPIKSSIAYGNTTSFSLQASGEGTLSYQWQVNTGAGWTAITSTTVYSNPTTPTLTLTKPSVSFSGYLYRCIVTASCGVVSSSEVSLTVTKVLVTVTAQNKSRIYGDRNPLFTVAYTGFVAGETFETSGLTGQPALATTAVASSAPGSYPITATVGTLLSANYSFSFVNAVLTISKAPLVVKADNQTRLYGSANPVLTWSYVGLMNNETAATSGITGSPNISTTANTSSSVGNYTISIATGSLASVNYSFTTFQAGTLTVAKAPLNVTAKDATRVYGAANPAFSVTYSGLVNNDQLSKTVSGTPTIITPATAASPVGIYDIIPGQGTLTVSSNYYLNYVYGKLSVTKANLSVIAQNAVRPYGAANPTFSIGFSGFLNGDTYATSAITGSATFTTSATLTSPVGNYSITPAAGTLSSPNYNFTSFVNGTLSVYRADLKVVADNKSKLYSKSNPVLTYHYEGFINGDSTTNNAVTGIPDLLLNATTTSDAGDYPIVVDMGTLASANYSFTLVNGVLTVDKAPLTVTAADTSRLYGAANPVFTYRITGFVNGQTLASAGVSGAPDITTPALPNSSAGVPYPVQVQQGSLSAKNYSFLFKNGVLTVLKVPLIVTADSKMKKYGSENPLFTATYSGFVNGETYLTSGLLGQPAMTTTATASSLPGSYDITISQGALLSTNYSFQFRKGTLEIIKKILQVTALPQSKKYGDPLPALTYTITGWDSGAVNQNNTVTGQPEMLTTATPSSNTGTYVIEPRLGSLSSSYYLFEFVSSNLTVTPAPLQIQVQDTARQYGDINPGYSLLYSGFVNGDRPGSSDLSGSPRISVAADAQSEPGQYPINLGIGTLTSQNYTFALLPGTLTILPAIVVVTAEDKTIIYGEKWPVFTYYFQGLKNGETESTAGLTGRTTATLTSAVSEGAGTYPIVFSDTTLQAPHYRFVYQAGVLTIRKASLLVKPQDYSKIYGEPDPEFAFGLSGFVKGDDLLSSRITGQPILKTNATQDSGAGNYKISVGLGTLAAPNYDFILGTGSFQIVKAPLTVIPRDTLRPYGSIDPVFHYTFRGFVNGDDPVSARITGQPLLTTVATAASLPGHYEIFGSAGTLQSDKYYFLIQSGDLLITKARLLAKADPATRAVGAEDPTFSYTLTGFVNGEDAASAEVSGSPLITSTALSSDPAGIYSIEIAVGDLAAPNYDIDVEKGLLYVFKAQIIYGDPLTCKGKTTELQLDASNLLAGYPYQIRWSTGDTTKAIRVSPLELHNYSVVIRERNNESADSITLTPVDVDTSVTIIDYTPGCNTQGQVRLQAGEAMSYQWLWNGQPVAQANSREWIATQTGTYQVIATNASGCVDTSRAVPVAFSPLPKADFTLNATQQCKLGNQVVTTNTSTLSQGTLTYFWTFGDGGQDSILNTSHSYTDTGVYAIQLVAVSEAGCRDSLTRWVSIRPNPVVSVNSGSVCQGASLALLAQGADTYTWSPATGLNAVTGSTVLASPATSTIYTVTGQYGLTGCSQSAQATVTVTPPVTSRITISSDAAATITSSTPVTFTAITSGGGTAPRYQWMKNGVSTGTNSGTYQNSSWVNKDSVYCILTSSETCVTGSPARSNTIMLAVSNGPYCPSNGVTTKEYIDKFMLSDLNNTSGNNNGYGDFSPVVVNLIKTKSYGVTVVPAWIGTARSEAYSIWIDLNKDGDFLDSGETVFTKAKTTATSVTGTIMIPSGVAVGLTKMRISMKYNILPTSCEVNFPGEVEDYGVFIQDPLIDNSPPTAPANLTAANITSASVDLSWSAATDNLAVTGYEIYQNGVLITTVTATAVTVTGLSPATSYSYTVKARDAAGNVSLASNTVSLTTPSITYCLSNGTTTMREYIDRFQLGTINNTSGFNTGYGNFTQLVTSLVLGSSNSFTIIPKWNGTVRAEAYRIWIDLNGDGDFADAGEQVANINKTTATSITGSLVIPTTAKPGNTRLRVTMKYSTSPGPCDVNISGEVEDYTVNIQ